MRVNVEDLRRAAEWLRCYDGEPDSPERDREAVHAIANRLDREADLRELDGVVRAAGLSPGAARCVKKKLQEIAREATGK